MQININIFFVGQVHCRKGQFPAAFWPLFKYATFEFCKYEFIMPKHRSNENFRPFCGFIDFLQMFKLEYLLHKSILMTEKCKILELRGFSHLGIVYFKNSINFLFVWWCWSKKREDQGTIFYSLMIITFDITRTNTKYLIK